MSPTRPDRIGPYEVLGLLGSGAMARVLRGRRADHGSDVALKVLHESVAGQPKFRAAFDREIAFARRFDHPGLVGVREAGEHEGIPWAAMDLVEGESLRDRLRRTVLSWKDAVAVFGEVARTLAHLHGRRVVHRDLKPGNILLTEAGGVRLVDLGIAVDLSGGGSSLPDEARAGTPAYMAPEQVLGEPPCEATDLYALGVCLFESLSGTLPWDDAGEAALLAAHVFRPPASLSSRASVPAAFDAVCAHCLAKKPGDRYRSAGELGEDLAAIARDPGIPPGATLAGRRLGYGRLRDRLPGRAAQIGRIRRWLGRVGQRRRGASILLLRGPSGSGTTALLEWTAREARSRGFDVAAPRMPNAEQADILVVDDLGELPALAVGRRVAASIPVGFPVPEGPGATVVDVGPLGAGAALQVLREELPVGRVDRRDLARILEASGGLPGRFVPLARRWADAIREGRPPAPGRVGDLLDEAGGEASRWSDRLATLEPSARLLVELAAWLDPCRTSPEELCRLLGIDPPEFPTHVRRFLQAGFPVSIERDQLRFLEPMAAAVVREATEPALRGDLAAAAAEALAGDRTADGLRRRSELLALLGDEEASRNAGWGAARELFRERRPVEGSRLVESLVRGSDRPLAGDGAELVRLAASEFRRRGEGSAAEWLMLAASPRATGRDRLLLDVWRGWMLVESGRIGEARGVLLGVARASRKGGDLESRVRSLAYLSRVDLLSARTGRALRILVALAPRSADVPPKLATDLLFNLAEVAMQAGDLGLAESSLARAARTAEESGLEESLLAVLFGQATLSLAKEDSSAATEILEEGCRRAAAGGNRAQIAFFRQWLGTVRLGQGRVEDAARELRSALHWAARVGDPVLLAGTWEMLARIALHRGDFDEARRRIRLTRRHDPGVPVVEAYARLAEADLELATGSRGMAAAILDSISSLGAVLDPEGELLREVLGHLRSGRIARDAEARGAFEELLGRLGKTWHAFRVEEFRRRAGCDREGDPDRRSSPGNRGERAEE